MINSLLVSTLLIAFSTSMGGIQTQLKAAYAQAVDLIEINSGNLTLDNNLPAFYDCIDEKIDESKGVEEDDYFEKEPTKNEVKICYGEVFLRETPLDNDVDDQDLDLGGN
jgi:hypothetical protein